jgi:predicted P-loop ATPase/GTPase
MDREERLKLHLKTLEAVEEAKRIMREVMLEKAKERGYEVFAVSGDHSWYSLNHNRRPINLQLYIDTEEFILQHNVQESIVRITTDKCGSFMNDEHFERIERQIRKVVFDLI